MVRFLSCFKFLSESDVKFGTVTVNVISASFGIISLLLLIDLSIKYFAAIFKAMDIEIKVSKISVAERLMPQASNNTWKLT